MPHGITLESVTERQEAKQSIWVRPLSDRNKPKKPMRVVGLSGHNAILEVIEGKRARQVRVALEKLEYVTTVPSPLVLPPPKPAVKESVLAMFPVLREEVEGKPAEKPPAPVVAPVPPAPPKESPVVANAFLVLNRDRRLYYTEKHEWTPDIARARHYPAEGGANKAAGRLMGKSGACKGQRIEVFRFDRARDIMDRPVAPPPPTTLAQIHRAEAASLPKPEPAPQKTVELPVRAAPSGELRPATAEPPRPTTMSDDMATLQTALEGALRAELMAYELLQHRKVEVARIKHDIDLHFTRRKHRNG